LKNTVNIKHLWCFLCFLKPNEYKLVKVSIHKCFTFLLYFLL